MPDHRIRPAGYSAAIYAARADLKPVIIEGPLPGGQLTRPPRWATTPATPNWRGGPEMMEDLKAQAKRFATDIRQRLGDQGGPGRARAQGVGG